MLSFILSTLMIVAPGDTTKYRQYENETVAYNTGDWCEVPAGTMHTEQTGAEGAKILFGKK